MAVTAVVGTALVLTAGATAYSASEARKGRKQAQAAADQQMQAHREQMAQLEEQQKKYETDQANLAAAQAGNENRDASKKRGRGASAPGAGGMRDTILTSPIGVTSQANTTGGGKTLLGS